MAFLLLDHFYPNLFLDVLFGASRVPGWVVEAFGILGWISFYALVLGVVLLCVAGVRRLVRLRGQSV
jgi:hypothetical protein